MGSGSFCFSFSFFVFEDNDGFFEGDFFGGVEEFFVVFDVFDVVGYDVGFWIVVEVGYEVVFVQICYVVEVDEFVYINFVVCGLVEDCCVEGIVLVYEGDFFEGWFGLFFG